MNEDRDYLWEKRHALRYRADLSALYHRRRERFFEMLDRGGKAIAVIGGAATIMAALPDLARVVAGVIVTIAGALSLVFGFSDRARRHGQLAASYGELAKDIAERGEIEFTNTDVLRWSVHVARIESDEPHALRGLVTLCQNDLAIREGHHDLVTPLPPHVRWLAQVIDFNVTPVRQLSA